MSTLSTHVLDQESGAPAAGMTVTLAAWNEGGWQAIGEATTDGDGRAGGFGEIGPGRFRLGFETGDWGNPFYPFVHVVFEVGDTERHYHIPLLLSPYGYTTYRGS